MSDRPLTVITEIDGEDWPADLWRGPRNLQPIDAGVESVARLSGNLEQAIDEMRLLLKKKAAITIYCHNEGEKQRLHELLLEKGGGIAAELDLAIGHISRGFYWPDRNWAALGDHEIFARKLIRRAPKKRFSGTPINDFTELNTRDYVVHILHGIARFEGIETLESNGTEQDYLVLRFAEDARVYVPLSHVELVQKYIGSRESRPSLSKLGGGAWTKRKLAVQKAVKDIAADLLRLQAVRQTVKGISVSEDDSLVRELEASFPYEETPDQLSAISDIKDDQHQTNPMDRLLCGDVGFGKTEVAIRAAFRVVNDGMQAAILVPTTILAEQHHRTFSERLADYPVTVACLSRFRSGMEQKRIVEACHEGRVDIVIGTHRLLSKDVGFKNLGLVVIDEEQRFGVEHKERLKSMRASVDILTMTATPIPRTLHMALLGLRDISNLVTPPSERQAVRTIVAKYKNELVRRAILRELVRGGQCFFLHNRVYNIDSIAADLSRLVPEARFGIAHGQMAEGELLGIMTRFLEGTIDVLVCTTIIESGVDIPSVNTLFVNNANHFGLADLHQLRGRVGRYCHQAYAYFLVPPQRPVTPVAQKRLQALMEYAELGAGFRLAMRDLELRGAGNVLGIQQSGHIHQIGFELYCRLLERSVAEFNGETMEESEPVELDLGTRGFIPGDYIISDSQRIDMYRRLNVARDLAALQNIREYIIDRYGAPPEPVERCLADQKIRCDATAVGICFIGRLDNALVIGFARSRAKEGVNRLRLLGRKVTPLEKQRWRIELSADEMETEKLLEIVEEIVAWFDKPTDAPSPLAPAIPPKPKLNVVYAGAGGPNRTSRIDLMTSSIEFPSEPGEKEEKDNTFAIQKVEASGSTLTVYLKSKETHFFGTVTLVTPKERYYLRCTGTTSSPDGFTGLILQAEDEEEAQRILTESGESAFLMQGVVD